MKISYSDWWDDIVALLRANARILTAVAGAFVFLPVLVAGLFLTEMAPLPENATLNDVVERSLAYYRENWLPVLAVMLVTTLGQLLIFIVLLDRARPRVADALRLAAPAFLPFFIVGILTSLIIGLGGMLFFVPALYLIGRVQLSGPALVAERLNPLQAIARSFALTKGQGWRIFFFAFLVFLVAKVIQRATVGVVGIGVRLSVGEVDPLSLAGLLLAIVNALFSSAFFLLAAALWITLYRRLAVAPNRAT